MQGRRLEMYSPEITDKISLYRQALSMVLCKEIADKTHIVFHSNELGETFWVNKAFRNKNGEIMVSPTGWKYYSPKEFDAEIDKLFKEARGDVLK